jgi:KUP system potassium uptake protein
MTPSPELTPPQPGPDGAGSRTVHHAGVATLTLGALGIVFGDIGTSPLYAMKQTFDGHHKLAPDPSSVYGVLSLIFWSITIIVSVKYVLLIMRADNHGEGGIMALISLVQGLTMRTGRAKWALVSLGAFGAALFYGDGMITPAISVLSAVEGLEVAEPSLDRVVIPITLVILTTLFFIQRFGTGIVGRVFEVAKEPDILRALSPSYAVAFFLDDGKAAFFALGSVVLAVTGAEALYADMGHFGPEAIRRSWFALVLPALVLNYLGQGALVLADHNAVDSPFYRLVPEWGQLPMVVLATMATVIASQAVISGAFSVTRQAVQLGFLPFLTIRHTSEREIGQIYVPAVNWALFVAIVGLVIGFGSSTALASAYGVAVTGTLAIDTVLYFVVVRMLWHKPLWMVLVGAAGFLTVDLAFFSANLTKVFSGGWFPLVVGLVMYVLLMTWRRGRDIVTRKRTEEEGPLQAFVTALDEGPDPPGRVPGTAVFLHGGDRTTPLALRLNVELNHVRHAKVVIFHAETVRVPHVSQADRIEVDELEIDTDDLCLVTARFGFQDDPDVPAALRLAVEHVLEMDFDVDRATYFLSRITINPTSSKGMARWRKRLFVAMSRNAATPVVHFGLPEERVVALGSSIDL